MGEALLERLEDLSVEPLVRRGDAGHLELVARAEQRAIVGSN